MKRLHCCPRGNGGSKSTGCTVCLHETSTWGHVRRRGFGRRELCDLKAVALIGVRGHGRGGKRRREERSLVAAALSKIGAGVALLVREVGVALLPFFLLEKAGYVCLLSLLRGCFHVVEIGRVPSIHNIRNVSTMTTDDSAVLIF